MIYSIMIVRVHTGDHNISSPAGGGLRDCRPPPADARPVIRASVVVEAFLSTAQRLIQYILVVGA